MVRRVVWTLLAAAALMSGCDGEPDIGLTTRLPIDARAGDNEHVLYAMCSNTVRGDPGAHIKITYYHDPDGRNAFTVVPFCSEILKEYAKYRDPSLPAEKR